MAVNRSQFSAANRRFFTDFDRWRLDPANVPNVFRDPIGVEELRLKAKRHKKELDAEVALTLKPVDLKLDWDQYHGPTTSNMARASRYFLFTGEERALDWALQALKEIELCQRPHFTYSTCMGVMDLDLRTATVVHVLAMMRCSFDGLLDDATKRRIDTLAIDRCIFPGLEAMRTKRYAWMHSNANWRIILCGMFGLGAMVWHEQIPEYREIMEYGIEGVLVALATGDDQGGWNEGPGYWEYGLSYAVEYAWILRAFTHGKVDLFKQRFLEKTGDFRLYMYTRPGQVWNWSDCTKGAGRSSTLSMLARVYQNSSYQWLTHHEGLEGMNQIYYLDPHLSSALPRGLPRTKHFPGVGVVVARTGFGKEDNFVGFKAGDMPDYNHHCQMDSGGMVIHVAGHELLAENEHWGYPREAPKDPKAPRPSRPGLFDEELKRYKRWDLDSVSAIGHNIPVVEGHYPQCVLRQPPKIKVVSSDESHDAVLIDSSVYYRPMASKVRRLAVYLRPDVVLVVDEIVASKPIRTRVQFHYLKKAAIERHDIRIVNGPASLLISPLSPSEEDNLIVGMEDRRTFYETPAAIVERNNRFAYIENLWRKKRLVFVTAMHFGKGKLKPVQFTLEGDPLRDKTFAVRVVDGRKTSVVKLDLAKAKVDVRSK
ncbi:MAG: hypothetical protein NTW19_18245 [Planctomycetota bacterium]|nr:hypothetical protein [Planctomycetota bacterium]